MTGTTFTGAAAGTAAEWRALREAAVLDPPAPDGTRSTTERRRLWLSVMLAFAAVMCAAGLLACSGYLISRASERVQILELTAVITAVRGFGIARAIFRYGERLVSHDLALRVLARTRAHFYDRLAPLGAVAVAGTTAGDLLSRFTTDVDALQDLYLRALAPPLTAIAVIICAGLVAALLLPVAGVTLVACMLLATIIVPALTGAIAASAGRRQAAARAKLTAELVESLDGAIELAVAGRSHERVGRVSAASERLAAIARRSALASAAATTLASAASGMTVIALLMVTIPAVHNGVLKPVLLAAIVLLALGAFDALDPLPVAGRSLRACAAAAGRLAAIGEIEPAVTDPPHPRPLPAGRHALSLNDVSYTYPDGTSVLTGVTLTIGPGARVALVGSSGTGKTTIAQLLVRFIDPTRGVVSYGPVDLCDLALRDARGITTYVAQDARVFTTTIRENLLLANRTATEAEQWQALAAVQLSAFVSSLPDGIDTLVGEDGELMSGGQRQRLTVARGLLADSEFLILDEPTAQLDDLTAAAMLRAVAEITGDRGLLIITHRDEAPEIYDDRYRLESC